MENITKIGLIEKNNLFWNVRSFLKRREEIQKVLNKIDILACVETYLNENNTNINFPGFVNCKKDNTSFIKSRD